MSVIKRALGTSVAILLVSIADVSRADEGATNALAEAMFREGRALLEAGQTAAACEKLEGSYRLDRRVGTLLNLAACREIEGRLATAWANFLDAARIAKARGGTPAARELEETARQRAAQLEPRLYRITLEIAEPADDLAITLDGRELPAAARQTALPIDPGSHVVAATRPGRVSYETKLDVPSEAGSRVVTIPPLAARPGEPSPAGPLPGGAPSPRPESDGDVARTVVIWGGATATVLAAGVGTFFGVRAISKKNERDDVCTGARCGGAGLSLQDEAFAASTASNVSFVIAAVAATVTVGALLWPRSARPNTSVSAAPLGFRF